jgi:Short repeat of unknown function (DUF308)
VSHLARQLERTLDLTADVQSPRDLDDPERHKPRSDDQCQHSDGAEGTAEAGLAISYRALPERGWHIFLGVLSIIAGIVVVGWPFASIALLAVVTGAWLVAIGIAQIVWALLARRGFEAVARRLNR